jgi:hypothetical protein
MTVFLVDCGTMGIDNDRPGPGLTDNRIITGRISEL